MLSDLTDIVPRLGHKVNTLWYNSDMKKEYDLGEFQRFLLREMDARNMSARALSIAAGLGYGAITHYLAGNRPSPESCRKLARYLGVPAERLLHLAGYISAPPDRDTFLKQVEQAAEGLTETEREEILDMVRLYRKHRQGK